MDLLSGPSSNELTRCRKARVPVQPPGEHIISNLHFIQSSETGKKWKFIQIPA